MPVLPTFTSATMAVKERRGKNPPRTRRKVTLSTTFIGALLCLCEEIINPPLIASLSSLVQFIRVI